MATISDVPENFVTLIGYIVSQFNLLDNSVMATIIELMGQNSYDLNTHMPYATMQFKTRKTLLDLIVKSKEVGSKGTPIEAYRKDLLSAMENVSNARNAITHSVWTVKDGVVYRRRLRTKNKVHIEKVPVTEEQLREIIHEIQRCRGELSELYYYAMRMRSLPQVGQK